MKLNFNSFAGIALVYLVFIVGAFIYFVVLQHFGFNGLQFVMEGKDQTLTPLDIVIILTLILSVVLLVLSLAAFSRKRTARLLTLSLVFFFFVLQELFNIFDNFFPSERIYTENAVAVLELLILLSFALFVYNLRTSKKK